VRVGQDRSHPHGIPDVPFVGPDHYKGSWVAGKKVLLTFGLLSPNKGIEHVINALRTWWRSFPRSSTSCWGHASPRAAHAREAYRSAWKS